MKQIVISIAAVFILLLGCNQSPNEIVINGDFDKAPQQTVYLSKLTIDAKTKVDSTITDEQGKFTLSRKINVPDFYTVSLKGNKQSITLALHPGDNIHIKANARNFKDSYVVTGSKDSRLIKELNEKLRSNISKIDSLGNVYRDNRNSPNLRQLKNKLDDEFRSIVEDQRKFSKSLIHDHPESLASLMALYQRITPRSQVLTPDRDFEQYAFVDSNLYSLYPESEAVKHLHKMVEKYKQKSQNQIQIGEKVPDIALPNPQGDTIKLSSLEDDYILLDFWASWCQPCRQENPNLVENYNEYKDQGFEIYQVSLDRNRKSWVNGIQKDNLDEWIHVSDLNYWNSMVVDLYDLESIPANYLLNKQGEVIAKDLRGNDLDQKLEQIFD